MSTRARFTVLQGQPEQIGQSFEVDGESTRLGRAPDCEVHLFDERNAISRIHAVLLRENGAYFLVHRSQTNPTFVDGIAVAERVELRGGEEVQLAGRAVLRFELVSSEQPQEATSPLLELVGPTTTPHHRRPVSVGDGADPRSVRLAIVGAGPAGIAAAVRAARRGIAHTLYERSQVADTIVKYQKGKLVMAEPPQLPLQSEVGLTFREGRREEVLEWWSTALRETGVNLALGTEVVAVKGAKGAFEVHVRDARGRRSEPATHVVVAIGEQGDLKKFEKPGDDQPWVLYQLDDPGAHEDKRVVVIGVGDAGIENAIALADNGNEVTVVNRRDEIDRAKPKNKSGLEARIKSGEIAYLTNLSIERFDRDGAVFKTRDGAEVKLECDLAIGRLGGKKPRKFLESLGIGFPSADEEAIPDVSEKYESNVPGIHLVGAVVGYPLIKNCLNQGFEVVEHILGVSVEPADEPVLAAKIRAVGGDVSAMLKRIQETVPVLAPLTLVQMRSLLFESAIRIEEPGTILYSRTDYDNDFFSILEGEVELDYPDPPGRQSPDEDVRSHPARRGVGAFFGEEGLISGRRRGETVTTTKRSILVETPRGAMSKLIRSVEDVRRVIDAAYADAALLALFPSLSEGHRQLLTDQARTLVHPAGAVVFAEGDAPDGLHLIRRGTVDVYKKHEGVEELIRSQRAGETLGESALLGPARPRSGSARASVDSETVLFPIEAVRACMESEREVRDYFERREREFVEADARRRHGGGTINFVMDMGGKEATDLLMIDETLCVRCDNCEKACAETHGGVSRLQREAGATYLTSSGSALHLPVACQHCENPKCMTDCPPDALHRDRNGEVWIDETCIGCGNCESYCPYGVIQMAKVDESPGPGLLMRLLFPFRATKKKTSHASAPGEAPPVKKAVKCDLCRDLPAKRSGAPRAACVAACPTGAIVRVEPDAFVKEIHERQG